MDKPGIYENSNIYSNKYNILSQFLEDNGKLFQWKTNEKVLDAGCGPGGVTSKVVLPWLPEDFQVLLGLDISNEMVHFAQSTYSDEKVKFEHANLCGDLSYILKDIRFTGGFHKIVSFYALQWVDDLNKAVKNLYALLRPSGEVFFTFPSEYEIDGFFEKARLKDEWKKYFKGVNRKIPLPITEETFIELMVAEGFEVEKCNTVCFSVYFESRCRFLNLVESIDVDMSCLPPHLKETYLQDCFDELEQAGVIRVQEDGRVVFFLYNLIVLGRKPLIVNA